MIKQGLSKLASRQDLMLVVLMVMTIIMMILPLPTVVIDVLLATNMALTVLLMMVGIYLRDPVEFSTLPSVILISTVFRLSLSISTTRLILVQADAGKIVSTFGEFVISGNLIVGLVVFLIITVVQFVVITKGSERVAEVSARFTLDALPGRQMSIDADLRNGDIDQAEAKRRRQSLQKESQLYGAMDGAMKFVKGDAIAG
ncbi:MAG: flagellar biosynthesis protein FlhA, partial [Alphaproteobacteria bacterium]|nr:flagellar biosynthesis protein FlhA [Alphaproteobacteria bacterium]